MFSIFLVLAIIFLISLTSFIYVLDHERRSMWAGFTLVITIFNLGLLFIDTLIMIENKFPNSHTLILNLLIGLMILFFVGVLLFILILIIMFIYNGIKLLRKEGTRWENFLSLGMGILLVLLFVVFPLINSVNKEPWLNFIYLFLLMTIIYIIAMMMMYTLTSLINLINWRHTKLNYIVVLGAGLIGKRVSPLLASRIKRGIEVYRQHPGSKLIMTGGQGPREEIPEGVAMAAYAREQGIPPKDIIIEDRARNTNQNIAFSHQLMKAHSKFCIVTNSYHVYRALVLAKRQHLQCVGYGAKTKWYFTLNAFIREFLAYLVITKKMQTMIITFFAILTLIFAVIYYGYGFG